MLDKALLYLVLISIFVSFYLPYHKKNKVKKKIKKLANSSIEVSPKEFFKIRTARKKGNTYISSSYDCAGVYILYNHSKKMYYVGQAKHLFSRVNQHFTGHGNGDVYADYKYGDEWTIKMIKLKGSGFKTLNELERNTISTYNAYSRGYNRTKGNKG